MAVLSSTFFSIDRFFFGGRFRRALQLVEGGTWRNSYMNSKEPVYIDLDNLLNVYAGCPHLQTVLTKKAEMLSNGCLKLRKKSNPEQEIENHWALELMKNPNPLQAQREFIYEYSLYFDIYANCFVYSNKPFSNAKPKTLFNLPSGQIKIIPTGKWLDQVDLKGIIEKYQMFGYSGDQWIRDFTTDEVSHINSGLSRIPTKSDSKLIALQAPVSNIISAYRTRNVLILENAAITIISSDSKDAMGTIKMGEEERIRVTNDFKKSYGLRDDQMRKIITSSPLTVTPLVFPVEQMKLFEEVEDDFAAICGAYGVDRDIFPSLKGATYENKKNGEIATYQGCIMTQAKTFCSFLDQLLLSNEDAEFYLDYSHLYILKADDLKEAQEEKAKVDSLSIMLRDGVISHQQYADLAGVEFDGDKTITTANQNATQQQ